MPQILFANNAATTLASAISSLATSLVVTSGGGALFPNPGTNQYFLATLSPATPGAQPQEIVRVTARSTNTFTITRAQESTTAQAWGTGTIVQNLLTAATVGAFPQTLPFAGNPNGNVSGAAASGNLPPSTVWDSANNLLYVCIASGTTATAQWAAQAPLTSPAFNGAPTAPNVTFGDNSFLLANTAFVAAGLAPKSDYTYVNAQLATRAPLTSPAFNGAPTAPNVTFGDNSFLLANTAFVAAGLAPKSDYTYVNAQLATRAVVNGSSAQQFNVANATTTYNAVNLSQFPATIASNGSATLPSGIIIKWGVLNITGGSSTVSFASAFPNTCLQVIVTEGAANSGTWGAGAVSIHGAADPNASSYTGWAKQWNGSAWISATLTQSYIAIGY
jgi:hypothetical protein